MVSIIIVSLASIFLVDGFSSRRSGRDENSQSADEEDLYVARVSRGEQCVTEDSVETILVFIVRSRSSA
jgi:hypothetical protein